MEKEAFAKKREKDYPNVEQMLNLVLRNKLDNETSEEERELYMTLFMNYWHVLIPKVAGYSHWGPAKKYHNLLSFGKLEDDDPEAPELVTASDEAFLAVLWMNCYNKWWYKEQCKRKSPKEDPDPDNSAMQTPFTDAKGGQKRHGGWNAEGIHQHQDLLNQIKKNRTEQAEYIKAVEEEALEELRKEAGIKKDDGKKKKKKKKNGKYAGIDVDETDDENDYDNW